MFLLISFKITAPSKLHTGRSLCVKLHTVCKITHCVYNYTQYVMYVKLHTVCELTHSVQNFTGVPCAFNMKKFPSLKIFYTHAVTDVTDKYQV